MKWYFLAFLLLYLKNIFCKLTDSKVNSSFNLNSDNPEIKNIFIKAMNNIKSIIFETFFKFGNGTVDFDEKEEEIIYNLIENMDDSCLNLFIELILDEKKFLNRITKKIFYDGGILQHSIGFEEVCLDEDEVYIFFTGPYNFTELREIKTSLNEEILFKESNYNRNEMCIFKECKNFYKPLLNYIMEYYKNSFNEIFSFGNMKILGIKYNGIPESESIIEDKSDKEKNEKDRKYYNIVYIILIFLGIFFTLCLIITWLIKKTNKPIETQSRTQSSESIHLKEESKQIPNFEYQYEMSLSIFTKEMTCEDLKWFKIVSSFDFLNNLSLLNQKKEPLSDQTSLIELSTIKILVLFILLFGENSYILTKFIEIKVPIFPFLKSYNFIFSKLGMDSYESYKILSGIIFGFKFINYYNKFDKFNAKLFLRFCSKPFPYIVSFLIIHFLLNYPAFIYAKKISGNFRNNFIAKTMCEHACEENPFNILNFFSVIGKYNSTNYNIGQYNGCTRPILFTISELICFYIVMVLIAVHIFFGNKVINIIYTIFFIFNYIYLSLAYFISRERNDLTGEYTISRLFNLSGSLAMPHLFFPLYYIGFNIGIIYYYHLNELSNKSIAEKEINNFIPFIYCKNISSVITRINSILKNIFMLIFLFLIIIISSIYSLVVNYMNEIQILFTFEEKPFMKYIFVYEGIIVGLLFSFLLLIYLCSSVNSFIRNILSSEFFIFSHKISFVFFITFISVLNFFHSIGIMEVNLTSFPIFLSSLTLFIITLLTSIIFTCLILIPTKWFYFFIFNGLDAKEIKEKLK